MDLKVMPRSNKGHKYISCIIDEVTSYLITVPIHQSRSDEIGDAQNYLIMVPIHQSRPEEIGDTLIENVIIRYCMPDYIIMVQDTFMSSLMNYLFKKLDIKIITVAPYNHHSLQAEQGIKSLSTILMKHLMDLGQMWSKYLPLATFAYNTFNSPNLANYSPYELIFGRKPKLFLNLETIPHIKVSGTFKDYCNVLNK